MLKGFKEFLLRGNIVDLAVAVVVGTAFVSLVAAFTSSFINPVLAAVGTGSVGDGLGFRVREGDPATFVDVGAFLTAVVAPVRGRDAARLSVADPPSGAWRSRFCGFVRRALQQRDSHGEPIRDLTWSGQPWCGGTSRR